jgi:hypothetical protein
MTGKAVVREIVLAATELPKLKTIVSRPTALFALLIAVRNEPAPPLAVEVTTKVDALSAILLKTQSEEIRNDFIHQINEIISLLFVED